MIAVYEDDQALSPWLDARGIRIDIGIEIALVVAVLIRQTRRQEERVQDVLPVQRAKRRVEKVEHRPASDPVNRARRGLHELA